MRLYDTAKKQYVDFVPGHIVGIYTCGITPYDAAHLGHIFTFMTYDLLQRRLEDRGYEVRLVRNVTDVDEPIYQRASELHVAYTELAATETSDFQAVLAKLNFRPAYAEPLASQYIASMARAVADLLEHNFAYRLEQDIYFDTSKDPKFGAFSGFSPRLQLAFMRQRGGDPDRQGKRQPLDFLLWRGITSASDPAAWESVVGRGRPGWHIECSVMANELLSTPFDLHGGGSDLIFPHHECELAQSFGLGQTALANHWLHVSAISYLGEKMSKSLGNLVFTKDVLVDYEPGAIRLALMRYHYRTGGEWQPEFLDDAVRLLADLRRLQSVIDEPTAQQLVNDIRVALDDDLDTHQLLHVLNDCCVRSMAATIGDTSAHETGSKLLAQGLGLIGIVL